MSASIQASATSRGAPARAASSRPAAIKRIAVGVDGFPEGRDAAALGAAIARATGAELMLVAVHAAPLLPAPPGLDWRSMRSESHRTLRAIRDSVSPGARMVTSTDSSVPRALHRAVARYHRDLLVVGSSRQGATGRVRIGKRTRQLLGQFDCALAVAPRGAHQRPKLVIHRIGVGYDGGSESEAALDLAASVAIAAGAELEVRTVVDDRIPMLVRPELDPGVAEWEDIVRREVEQARVLASRAARATGARFGVVVERGRPSDGLLALSGAVDLLVIGSRRWGPAARLLLGSTGEALMHDAACPVLAVPRPTGRHRP